MVCEMTEVNENNTHMGSYGLGWLIEPYRGLRMVSHGGNIDGFTAHVAFIPAEKIGVVVLSNLNGTPLPVFISNYIFDSLLGGEVKDWSGLALGQKKEATVASEPPQTMRPGEKQPIVPLSASLLDLAGTYVHAGYGEMVVELVDGGLRAGFNSMLFPHTSKCESV